MEHDEFMNSENDLKCQNIFSYPDIKVKVYSTWYISKFTKDLKIQHYMNKGGAMIFFLKENYLSSCFFGYKMSKFDTIFINLGHDGKKTIFRSMVWIIPPILKFAAIQAIFPTILHTYVQIIVGRSHLLCPSIERDGRREPFVWSEVSSSLFDGVDELLTQSISTNSKKSTQYF